MITSSYDGTIIISDIFSKNLKPVKLEGHKSLINDISINPSGTYLVSASSDHTIRLWDLVK
jgi:WD40 repeat protein